MRSNYQYLVDKIAELQKDLRDSKRELKETAADKEALEQRYIDLADSLEMMTLDKEVAEERAEALQEEVDFLKEKMEEISVDLDILKKEAGNQFAFCYLPSSSSPRKDAKYP